MAILAIMAVLFTAFLSPAPTADASPTAYTYLFRPAKGWAGDLHVRCHSGVIGTMRWQTDSTEACSSSGGWVDGVADNIPATLRVHVKNWNTGNQTDYPCGWEGNIGGGYYDFWVNSVGC
jgi:hypothetical protein